MRYVKMMKKGIFSAVFTNTHAFLCTLPNNIRFNENEQLHSVLKPAIEMLDGENFYFIKGVRFDKVLWKKITSKTMEPKDIMKLKNIEQRYIAFDMFGCEELLTKCNAVEIDIYKTYSQNLDKTTEIKLHSIKGVIEGREIKLLTYSDPSTERPYFSFVPPETKTAKEAMAWKFQMKEEDYEKLVIQA